MLLQVRDRSKEGDGAIRKDAPYHLSRRFGSLLVPDFNIRAWLMLGSGVVEVFAPRGQGSIARGVRPWNRRRPPEIQSRKGDSRFKARPRNHFDLRPLRGSPRATALFQGLKPLAIHRSPSGA